MHAKVFPTLGIHSNPHCSLGGVFRYFHNSPVREEALHFIQTLLDETETHLKEPKFTRWLSYDAAVGAFMKCFKAVLVAFGREATERKDIVAKAYLQNASSLKFVASLCMFSDLLPHLSRLSRVFQKSTLNFSELQPALDTALMSVEQLQARPGPTEDQIEDYLESVDLKISDVPSKLLMWRRSVRQPYFRSLRCESPYYIGDEDGIQAQGWPPRLVRWAPLTTSKKNGTITSSGGFFFSANKITDAGQKRAVLLTVCGPQTYKLIRNLVAPEQRRGRLYADCREGERACEP